MKAVCPRCKYEWTTKSKMVKVTCPSCYQKVNNPIAVLKVAEALRD